MKDKIKPTLVLTVICVIASLLLTYAHELTKTRIADQKEQNCHYSRKSRKNFFHIFSFIYR